jgi:hypothetical protein
MKYPSESPERARARQLKFQTERPEKVLLNRIRTRAKAKGITFSLTSTDIVIPELCPALGIALLRGGGDCAPSVDRHIPSKGYISGNVSIISHKANRIKNDSTVEEMEKVLNYMRAHARNS